MAIPSDFIDLSQSKFETKTKRSRTRTIEWLIAIMFIVSLLLGSGVFLKVSIAADLRVNGEGVHHHSSVHQVFPGTLGIIAKSNDVQRDPVGQLREDGNDNSCELKS